MLIDYNVAMATYENSVVFTNVWVLIDTSIVASTLMAMLLLVFIYQIKELESVLQDCK